MPVIVAIDLDKFFKFNPSCSEDWLENGGRELLQPGWKFVKYGFPKTGDYFLSSAGAIEETAKNFDEELSTNRRHIVARICYICSCDRPLTKLEILKTNLYLCNSCLELIKDREWIILNNLSGE